MTYLVEVLFVTIALLAFVGTGYLVLEALMKLKKGTGSSAKERLKAFSIVSASLLVTQYIGLLLWYGPLSRFVDEADPFMSFMTFIPISWTRVFEGFDQTFFEPAGSFFTTGQVANLHTGLVLLLSLTAVLVGMGVAKRVLGKEKSGTILHVGLWMLAWHQLVLSAFMLV